MKNRLIYLFMMLFLLLSGSGAGAANPPYPADQVIVKYKSESDLDRVVNKHASQMKRKNSKLRVAGVKLPAGMDLSHCSG